MWFDSWAPVLRVLLVGAVSYVEGLAALALLAGLRFVVAWVSSRWPGARSALTSQPTALLVDGSALGGILDPHEQRP